VRAALSSMTPRHADIAFELEAADEVIALYAIDPGKLVVDLNETIHEQLRWCCRGEARHVHAARSRGRSGDRALDAVPCHR